MLALKKQNISASLIRLKSSIHYQRKFEIERNIKNHLYAFIIENNLYLKLQKYERNNDMTDTLGFQKIIIFLVRILKSKKKKGP